MTDSITESIGRRIGCRADKLQNAIYVDLAGGLRGSFEAISGKGYLLVDNTEIGSGNGIPLYLAGFLY